MKKAPFLAVLVLRLGGCTADGDVNDGYEGNNSAAVEEQIGNRENDRLYVNGDGDGYFDINDPFYTAESGLFRSKTKWYKINEKIIICGSDEYPSSPLSGAPGTI